MNLQTCLKLAEYAKNDPSLIKNHTDGGNGVNYYLKNHLDEVDYLLGLIDDDAELIKRLKAEKIQVTSALAVYN